MAFRALAFCALLILGLSRPGSAEEAETMVQKVQARTQALKEYQRQRRLVLDQLYQVQQNIKTIAKNQGEVSARSQRMRVELEKSQESLLSLKEELSGLRQRVGGTALILSQVDASRMMQILFASKSPAELDRSIKFFGILIQKELKVLAQYQDRVRDVQTKSEEIQQVLADIELSEQEMLESEQALKKEHADKLQLVSNLDRRRKQEVESLKKLRLTSLGKVAALLDSDEQIKKYLRPSFIEQQGKLMPPLEGKVLGSYGLSRDAALQTELSSGGWFIERTGPSEVRAPFPGEVAVALPDDKLQSVVILDHGHDYYTSYSGLRDLQIQVGDWVEEGELLGSAGHSTRWNTEGLHFEIRHFSEPQDPSRWVHWANTYKQAALED